MECEYKGSPECECSGEVKLRRAMTAYHWDGKGENPNRDLELCDAHHEAYREHWNSMWEEFRNSQTL